MKPREQNAPPTKSLLLEGEGYGIGGEQKQRKLKVWFGLRTVKALRTRNIKLLPILSPATKRKLFSLYFKRNAQMMATNLCSSKVKEYQHTEAGHP